MRRKINIIILTIAVFLACNLLAADSYESNVSQQKSVELTVYNQDLALIKDVREINIPSGSINLKFMDVASSIKPETVSVKSLGAEKGFKIIEQNYEYDLISKSKLLDKYVGKKIK